MIKVKVTAKEAYAEFKKWADLPKSKAPHAPWVYNLNIAGCALGYGWFVKYPHKQWTVSSWVAIARKEGTYRPADGSGIFGDAVIFDWTGKKNGNVDHIGFFIKEDKNYVWNISANSTGGLVRIKKTSKRYVAGYGTVVKFKEEKAPVVTPVAPTTPTEAPTTPPVAPKPPVVVNPPIVVPADAKPKHKYDIIEKGDSYWAIARRELSVTNTPKNYARIAAKSAKIQTLNKNKRLFPGESVRVS